MSIVQRLVDGTLALARILKDDKVLTPATFAVSKIRIETVMLTARDGTRLATDVYLPPGQSAPAIAVRTPYNRGTDPYVGAFLTFARRGYAVVSQDLRGTGDSEPDSWDYYVCDAEDGYDLIDWISKQSWYDGFIGSTGGSYVGQTQWQMAMHPAMSTIVPDVSGLGAAVNTARLHMFCNAFSRSIGKGEDKVAVSNAELEALILDETLATGFFNEPLHKPFSKALHARFPNLSTMPPTKAMRWLWEQYCSLTCAGRAELIKQALGIKNVTSVDIEALPAVFGQEISHDRHTLPHPDVAEQCKSLHAPVLLRTGWYDWGLNDAFETWKLLMENSPEPMRSQCRLFIAPSAHNVLGYHENLENHPELHHAYRTPTTTEFLMQWYATVRTNAFESWPKVIYYLMGANEWRTADAWPVPEAKQVAFYVESGGNLSLQVPQESSEPDRFTFDPNDPTPTVGGSILSSVYSPGSVDVSKVQQRTDVLTYTTEPLKEDMDIVGPLQLVLFASSSATDTDFSARLSDVFPDGRAIQLQNCILRARYRDPREPALIEPGQIYRFEIDMWGTANRFKAGHRLRVDIASADFPKFDRNANRGGEPGPPIPANQTVYHDRAHPSHLVASILRV